MLHCSDGSWAFARGQCRLHSSRDAPVRGKIMLMGPCPFEGCFCLSVMTRRRLEVASVSPLQSLFSSTRAGPIRISEMLPSGTLLRAGSKLLDTSLCQVSSVVDSVIDSCLVALLTYLIFLKRFSAAVSLAGLFFGGAEHFTAPSSQQKQLLALPRFRFPFVVCAHGSSTGSRATGFALRITSNGGRNTATLRKLKFSAVNGISGWRLK